MRIYFGSALKANRNKAGKTLKETAKAISVSESYLSRVENGECAPPREETIIRAAEFFGVEPDELIYASVRQREGVHAVVAQGTLEVYGRLLEQLHSLEPSAVEEIDSILLRHFPARTQQIASLGRNHVKANPKGRGALAKQKESSHTKTKKENSQGQRTSGVGSTRNIGGRQGSASARAQREAHIKHSPRSNLKAKEDTRDQETVVH